MAKVKFLVQGSAPDPYEVTFIKDGNNMTALCTCAAGQNGQYCKHRIRILDGAISGIVSDNTAAVKTVTTWLVGTAIEAALREVKVAEAEMEKAEKNLTRVKKALARAMHN